MYREFFECLGWSIIVLENDHFLWFPGSGLCIGGRDPHHCPQQHRRDRLLRQTGVAEGPGRGQRQLAQGSILHPPGGRRLGRQLRRKRNIMFRGATDNPQVLVLSDWWGQTKGHCLRALFSPKLKKPSIRERKKESDQKRLNFFSPVIPFFCKKKNPASRSRVYRQKIIELFCSFFSLST